MAGCCTCLPDGSELSDNECNTAGDCCTEFGSTFRIGTDSCADNVSNPTLSCISAKGTIGVNSCTDIRSCKNTRATIVDGSCHGIWSCENDVGSICDDSWLGYKSCKANYGTNVRARSCQGKTSCFELNNAIIGDGSCSCNCEACCACPDDGGTVPNGSCNSLAADPGDIDFVDGVGGTYCCHFASLPA